MSGYKEQRLRRVIGVDTREQRPWTWPGIPTEGVTMKEGDYCLLDENGNQLAHLLSVERKSLPDWIGSISSGRARFERELERLCANCYKAVVVIEANIRDILNPELTHSRMNPTSVIGSVAAWQLDHPNVEFCWAGDRDFARGYVYRLFLALERRLDGKEPPAWVRATTVSEVV